MKINCMIVLLITRVYLTIEDRVYGIISIHLHEEGLPGMMASLGTIIYPFYHQVGYVHAYAIFSCQ